MFWCKGVGRHSIIDNLFFFNVVLEFSLGCSWRVFCRSFLLRALSARQKANVTIDLYNIIYIYIIYIYIYLHR